MAQFDRYMYLTLCRHSLLFSGQLDMYSTRVQSRHEKTNPTRFEQNCFFTSEFVSPLFHAGNWLVTDDHLTAAGLNKISQARIIERADCNPQFDGGADIVVDSKRKENQSRGVISSEPRDST